MSRRVKNGGAAGKTAGSGPPAEPLSQRQTEILRLLRAGKANKDIASELGIGVGTVKQHVVALFRKLSVTSRTAAVTRSLDLLDGPARARLAVGAVPSPDEQMELRVAAVLSLSAFAGSAPDGERSAWHLLQAAVAAATSGLDCTLVSRPGNSIDVIFGLHRVAETDCVRALHTAHAVFHAIDAEADRRGPVLPRMQAGLAAGMLLASMQRRGGWRGDLVAGRLIGAARDLREAAPAGSLLMDPLARRLIHFRGNGSSVPLAGAAPHPIPLGSKMQASLVGEGAQELFDRKEETDLLRRGLAAAAAGLGGVMLIEGEAGMGKTALGRSLARPARLAGVAWVEGRCGGASGLAATLAALARPKGRPSARPPDGEAALAGVERMLAQGPVAMLVDEVDHATPDEAALVGMLAERTRSAALFLLCIGRRVRHARLAELAMAPPLRLGGMPDTDMAALVAAHAAGGLPLSPMRERIRDLAHGVPLFAVELTRAACTGEVGPRGEGADAPVLPTSLVALILSRLDTVKVDRLLLRLIARLGNTTTEHIAQEWPDPRDRLDAEVDAAVAAGILRREEDGGRITFRHPLVREVLRYVMVGDGSPGLGMV